MKKLKGFLNDKEVHLNYDCVLHIKEPSMKFISPFFLPTEVVLIDDDVMLLNRIKRNLSSIKCSIESFDIPQEALVYLKQAFTGREDFSQLKLENLHRQIYSSDRFKKISAIIVDYDMPAMNGLEVCRQITSPHIQKIMLTGAATHELAVAAFNEGIIHQFIQKNDTDVYPKLQSAVISAQEKYFETCTIELMHAIQNDYPESAILHDPDFMSFFEGLVREKNIVEYYLLDPIGNFLFLSETENPSALFVFNEEMLEAQEDMIPEDHRNTELAQAVYAKKQAICFYPFKTTEKYDPENWKSYLQPIKCLETKSSLFYAYASELPCLDHNKIVAFKD